LQAGGTEKEDSTGSIGEAMMTVEERSLLAAELRRLLTAENRRLLRAEKSRLLTAENRRLLRAE
jgi:hypothetical protein